MLLGSMLFCVLQYLPFPDEETHTFKTIQKKLGDPVNENDNTDDDSNDDDNDGNEFLHENSIGHFSLTFTKTKHTSHSDKFQSLTFSINTPPPKI